MIFLYYCNSHYLNEFYCSSGAGLGSLDGGGGLRKKALSSSGKGEGDRISSSSSRP